MEEEAETSLQLKDRVSPGLRVMAVGVRLGNHGLGTALQKPSQSYTSPQAACESTSSSAWSEESTASSWAGQRGRRKEKQSFLSALGHGPMYALGHSFSRACKESKEEPGLVSLENGRHLRVAFEAQKKPAE